METLPADDISISYRRLKERFTAIRERVRTPQETEKKTGSLKKPCRRKAVKKQPLATAGKPVDTVGHHDAGRLLKRNVHANNRR
jgi:hypothetical protein